MRLFFGLVMVAACHREGDLEPSIPPVPPLDTGDGPIDTGAPVDGFEASCGIDPANALRARCTVRIEPPGPVEVAFEGGGESGVTASDHVARTHELTLVGLTPWTTFTWEARPQERDTAAQGTFATGDPPGGLDVTITATGSPTFPYLLMPDVCGGTTRAIIARTSDGKVVWYDDLAAGVPNGGSGLEVVGVTEDGTVLGLTGGGVIVETTLAGERRQVLRKGVDFEDGVHHDVWRRGEHTYVLFAELVESGRTDWIVDGFLVFDGQGEEVARWRLADHVPLPDTDPGGTVDWSHANAVWTDADGKVYLSLRHLSAVLKVEGDLSSPSFGSVEWQLVGAPSDLESDFAGEVDFQQQHNAHRLPDGTLALFDNRLEAGENSRVVRVSLDEGGREAEIAGTWTLDQHCPFHGAAWHTAGGNPVATCGPMSTIYEFDGGRSGTEPLWRAEIGCGGAPGTTSIPRAVPLDRLPAIGD